MDDPNNQKEKLIFSENIGQILSDILKEYKLEETDDEISKKIEGDQPFSGEIIMDAIRDLFFGKIQEKDLPALLQQKLNISQNATENLFNSIKIKLVPLIKKAPEEQAEEEEVKEGTENKLVTEIKPPIGVPPIGETMKDINREEILSKSQNIIEKKLARNAKKIPEVAKEIEKPVTKPRKPDSYREPVE